MVKSQWIGKVLKTEFVGEENEAYKINCLLDNSVPSIELVVLMSIKYWVKSSL